MFVVSVAVLTSFAVLKMYPTEREAVQEVISFLYKFHGEKIENSKSIDTAKKLETVLFQNKIDTKTGWGSSSGWSYLICDAESGYVNYE